MARQSIIQWDVVKNGAVEYKLHKKYRGHLFEQEAINHFEKISKASVERYGFFNHPFDDLYSASPDGLGPSGILV